MMNESAFTDNEISQEPAPCICSPVCEAKLLLRREIRSRALKLDPEYCRSADLAIREQLFDLPEYRNASRIFCFVSRPAEVDTRPIIHNALSAGKTIAVPRCAGDGIMYAHCIQDPDADLFPGMFGIPEPSPEARIMKPSDFDLILVPCCSCSHTGKRLGFGGGFYDRYLEKTSAVTIVLCREKLTVSEIPSESFDRDMDIVLTEAGVFRRFSS